MILLLVLFSTEEVFCWYLPKDSSCTWNWCFCTPLKCSGKDLKQMLAAEDTLWPFLSFLPPSLPSFSCSVNSGYQKTKRECCFKSHTAQTSLSFQVEVFWADFQLTTWEIMRLSLKKMYSWSSLEITVLIQGEMYSPHLTGCHFRPVQWSPGPGWLGSGWFPVLGRTG